MVIALFDWIAQAMAIALGVGLGGYVAVRLSEKRDGTAKLGDR